MNIDIDVLIIFADQDNLGSGPDKTGWAEQFKRFLELMLTQVLGSKPNVLLKGEHNSMVAPRMEGVGALVPVLSEDFIKSGNCLDSLEAFFKANESVHGSIQRVFKVFKSPLSQAEQPPRIREFLGYEMYKVDPESGEAEDYTDYFTTDAERQYWMKMVDLAYDIYDALVQLKSGAKPEIKDFYKRKTIYLAETGHDLSVQRNIIKRELQRHGYIVLPNLTLSHNFNDLEKTVKADMDESSLSIHLIGSSYGEIPEGTDRSIVDIQNRIAAEKSAHTSKEDFSRLIWIAPTLSNASDRQRSFIESLKRDVEAQEGAEILQTPLEDFKNIMREELIDSGDRKPADETGGKAVYLVHDKVDQNEVKPLIDALKKEGYQVLVPDFDGELLAVRKRHIDNLRNFDSAIIYQGKVNEQWVRMKVLDLLKAPGFGRKKPIIGRAILKDPGAHLNLDAYKSQNLRVIETEGSKAVASMNKLLEEFKA